MLSNEKDGLYIPLAQTEEDEESRQSASDDTTRLIQPPSRQTARDVSRRLCAITIGFLAVLSLALAVLYAKLLLSLRHDISSFGSFSRGFNTEISSAFGAIELERVTFTGGLRFDDDGRMYRNVPQDAIDYAGRPNPESDEAWAKLVGGRYPRFHETQYQGVGSHEALKDADTRTFELGVDVLHALHCLDRIRKVLHHDYDYYKDEPFIAVEAGEYGIMHVQHCVDYVRQMLQCKADLTPLPVYWSASANRSLPDFDTVHTCRNFAKIRQFATDQDQSAMEIVHGVGHGK